MSEDAVKIRSDKEVLIMILNMIETTAFRIRPPNVWTPMIVGQVIEARNIVYSLMNEEKT